MPPAGEPLDARQIGLLRAWIDQSNAWPEADRDEAASRDPAAEHWAFQPVRRPHVPADHNPIDYFVLERLRREGLAPASQARPLHAAQAGFP